MEKRNYIPEKALVGHTKAIPIEILKVLIELTEKFICKIKCDNGENGTGFFCNILLDEWNSTKALITNEHILKEDSNKTI